MRTLRVVPLGFAPGVRMFIKNILSSLRNPEFWIYAALSILGLGVCSSVTLTGTLEFLLRYSDVLDFMCCLFGTILVGYTVVVGMQSGPHANVAENVTVETQENMSESVEKRYLKI